MSDWRAENWQNAYVVDSSVVLNYLLSAKRGLDDVRGDAVAFFSLAAGSRLVAPVTLLYEVTGAIARHRRARLIGVSEAKAAMAGFLGLEIELIGLDYEDAERLAELGANLASADATFVHVAEQLRIPLVTQDKRLRNGARLISKAVVIGPEEL